MNGTSTHVLQAYKNKKTGQNFCPDNPVKYISKANSLGGMIIYLFLRIA